MRTFIKISVIFPQCKGSLVHLANVATLEAAIRVNFKILCHLSHVGCVVTSWSLTQEFAGSTTLFTKNSEFSENIYVILGNICLHVLSKGAAFHKAVGC